MTMLSEGRSPPMLVSPHRHGRVVLLIVSRASQKWAIRGCERRWSSLLAMAARQPDAMLARWFNERVARNGRRLKKAAIVALARKLLVALWK